MMWRKFSKTCTTIGISIIFAVVILFPSVSWGNDRGYDKGGVWETATCQLPVIMLTGYWDPTGKMIAPFSTSAYLNPGGWKGGNWENQGYDIQSFFPNPGVYNGTFEVDYQVTWEDFWEITSTLHPVAIISFGSGDGPWEIENNTRNLDYWINDGNPPNQPTPSPPDDTVPMGYIRHSTLPVQAIADAVNAQNFFTAWVDWDGFAGMYLCEYIGYLGMWYQSLHSVPGDPYPCRAAGFIHVDDALPLSEVMEATNATLRETIRYLKGANTAPGTPIITGPSSGKIGTPYEYSFTAEDPDGDAIYYLVQWGEGCPSIDWLGPYQSGEGVTLEYTWDQKGTYTISAKAKDIYEAESDWGTLEVSMPKTASFRCLWDIVEQIIAWFSNLLGDNLHWNWNPY